LLVWECHGLWSWQRVWSKVIGSWLLKNKDKRDGHWSWQRVWSKVIGCGLIKNKRNVMVIGRGGGFG
jgi:hypothetical protein